MPRVPKVYLRDILDSIRKRDVLIRGYFTVDLDIVWDIVQNKVPELKAEVLGMMSRMDGQ